MENILPPPDIGDSQKISNQNREHIHGLRQYISFL